MTRLHATLILSFALAGCLSHARPDVDAGNDSGCVCSDAPSVDAPAARVCGGFAGTACLPTEFCDFPEGSLCGSDDGTGVCRLRPTECSDPGGIPVCGCDGRDYLTECTANMAGVDAQIFGSCADPRYRVAAADRECGPLDGPAWRITVTTSRDACAEARPGGSLLLSVWHELGMESPEITYRLGGSDGSASFCDAPGAPCINATGTVVFHIFATGEVARFDYDITTMDGRHFAETNVELARFWCDLTGPTCG